MVLGGAQNSLGAAPKPYNVGETQQKHKVKTNISVQTRSREGAPKPKGGAANQSLCASGK